jgi:hypothetical protein
VAERWSNLAEPLASPSIHFVGDVLGSRKFFEAIEEGTLAVLRNL